MRSGSHGSVAGSMPEAAATALPTTVRGNGKSTLAQMPSAFDSRCVSQRSIPRVGTAMTSRANGSGGGSANSAAEGVNEAVGPVGSVDVEHGFAQAVARAACRPDSASANT